MIRRLMLGAGAILVPFASYGVLARRGAERLLRARRTMPGEAALKPALDALGGEIVRLRSRDGVRLAGRWLDAEPEPASHAPADEARARAVAAARVAEAADAGSAPGAAEALPDVPAGPWVPDPHEAILLLHGHSGSISPDLVEYGPFLRRTAGVLGLDFRGHGASDPGPTTFGVLEVEDAAGALAWLGERGIRRVALVGTSLGAITAIEAVAILGDGSLTAADAEPDRPRAVASAPRPRIVAVVADSASPEVAVPVASRLGVPFGGRLLADRLFAGAARILGVDPRDTEPGRVVGLVAPVPLLLIHGGADRTTPVAAARRLALAAGEGAHLWVVPGADHSGAHMADPDGYEARVTGFLRAAFAGAREHSPIIRTEVGFPAR